MRVTLIMVATVWSSMSAEVAQTDRTVEKFEDQPIVDEAWAADEGYVIAILSRVDTRGSIFQLIDLAEHLDMDGEIRIRNDHLHRGEERDAVHLEHVRRT